MKHVYTNDGGKMEAIEPFTFLRGIDNKNTKMGQAKDDNGTIWDIFTDNCDLDNGCYCGAKAVEPSNQ